MLSAGRKCKHRMRALSGFGNALAVYALRVAATYLLEGSPRTLLRPEAAGLRLAYALLAVLFGVYHFVLAWPAFRWKGANR